MMPYIIRIVIGVLIGHGIIGQNSSIKCDTVSIQDQSNPRPVFRINKLLLHCSIQELPNEQFNPGTGLGDDAIDKKGRPLFISDTM